MSTMNTWIIQISTGTGPLEVRTFAAHLAEHLRAVCAQRGLRVLETRYAGPTEAPRSVEITTQGPTPAALADYVGTHALIAASAQRGRRARKRWFAGVTVHEPGTIPRSPLDPDDVEMHASRAGGPGGQNVNRRASAVRAVHRPTALAVRVTDERSQHANRRLALARLAERIEVQAAREQARQLAERRQTHYALVRGGAVRTWRLDRRGRGLVAEED